VRDQVSHPHKQQVGCYIPYKHENTELQQGNGSNKPYQFRYTQGLECKTI